MNGNMMNPLMQNQQQMQAMAQQMNMRPPNQVQPSGAPFNFGQTNRIPMMPGRVVNSPDEIMPNEVPMDGTIALFMLRDGSSIIAKAWNQYGTITTVPFAPVIPQSEGATTDQTETQPDPFKEEVLARLDKIEKFVKNKPYYKKGAPRPNTATPTEGG